MQNFVNAANTVLQTISGDLAYDPTSGITGPLNGDFNLESLAQRILSTVGQAIGTSGLSDGSSAGSAGGLSLNSSGTLSFNATTFAQDFEQNPTAIASLFTQGGSYSAASPASPGDVELLVRHRLQPARDLLRHAQPVGGPGDRHRHGGLLLAELDARCGGDLHRHLRQHPGELRRRRRARRSPPSAQGLDSAFAAAGLDLSAQVVTQGSTSRIQITSAAYGSAQSFSVSSSGSDQLGLASGSVVHRDRRRRHDQRRRRYGYGAVPLGAGE